MKLTDFPAFALQYKEIDPDCEIVVMIDGIEYSDISVGSRGISNENGMNRLLKVYIHINKTTKDGRKIFM